MLLVPFNFAFLSTSRKYKNKVHMNTESFTVSSNKTFWHAENAGFGMSVPVRSVPDDAVISRKTVNRNDHDWVAEQRACDQLQQQQQPWPQWEDDHHHSATHADCCQHKQTHRLADYILHNKHTNIAGVMVSEGWRKAWQPIPEVTRSLQWSKTGWKTSRWAWGELVLENVILFPSVLRHRLLGNR